MPPKPTLTNYLQLHFVVLIWGFTAVLGLLADSVSAWGLVIQRTVWAAVGLGLVLLIRQQPISLPARDRNRLLGVGVILAVHWFTFFGSARVANASVSLVGLATCSLWCSLLEPVFFRRAIRPLDVLLGAVAAVGLLVIFRVEFSHALGLSLALLTAFLSAVFTILNGQFVQRIDALVITFYEMIGAVVTGSVLALVYGWLVPSDPITLWPADPADWLWILTLAFVCTVYAYTAAVHLMRKFSPFAINLTVNLEPVYGIALAVLIFGRKEAMSPGFYGGAAIILAAVLAYPLLNRRVRPASAVNPASRAAPATDTPALDLPPPA
jgi:drug/metabolite transporter (DMT)-like permease